MRTRAVPLYALLLTIPCVTPRAVAAQRLESAAWLAGCWEQAAGARIAHEQWMAPRGGLMLGMSRTVVRDTAREFEHLRIESRGGRVAYVAHPSGQAETVFSATQVTDTILRFENPAHDFPQRIQYRRISRDSIVARIEGSRPQQPVRGIDFPMRRVSCGGDGA